MRMIIILNIYIVVVRIRFFFIDLYVIDVIEIYLCLVIKKNYIIMDWENIDCMIRINLFFVLCL